MPDDLAIPDHEDDTELAKEIEALKLAVGPYPDLDNILAGNPLSVQKTILRVFLKVERNSTRIELRRHRPTLN